ncbi:MAG TPA: hypothetical protein VHX42_02850 [Candidatus Babeliales bacterium]|jgi:hypothetical protein|nr:hypothetical protein [Candidatus Babeliales bacterium]
MKKITTLLLSACAFTSMSNSFGMLTKTSPIRKVTLYKQARSLNAIFNTECYSCTPADCLCKKRLLEIEQSLSKKTNVNNSTEEIHKLLHKIIEQNETSNELLKAIIKQKQLSLTLAGYTKRHYKNLHYNVYPHLEKLYSDLNIKVDTYE